MLRRSGSQSRESKPPDAAAAATGPSSSQGGPVPPFSRDPSPGKPSAGDDARAVEQLRLWRNRSDPGTALDGPLSGVIKDLSDRRRALRGADGAWASIVPPFLRDRFRLLRIDRGVLRVAIVDPHDSAAGYDLDRWLRSGGLEALRVASKNVIKHVKPAP